MKYTVYITSSALTDIRTAVSWYVAKSASAARQFEHEVKEALDAIHSNPYVFQERYSEVRVSFLTRFPYGVFYTVVHERIVILAVIHSSQSPERWPKPQL
ncbi:MAG: hypothetical protein C0424_04490 [Sphingobacteriaceae bacterium]|nr:hypothetical protein [Sphingobacteriaceae bacterium]